MRAFLDRYGLNLLTVPRAAASIGDLYVVQGGRVLPPASVNGFLRPTPQLPPARHETLADLSGVASSTISWEAGIGLFEGFLAALGAAALVDAVKAEYRRSQVASLSFRFSDCRRTSVDLGSLGSQLTGARPDPDHPLWTSGSRYYLATGVVRSQSLSVRAERADGQAAKLDLSVLRTAGVAAAVSVAQTGAAELRYAGTLRLAIGVELVELRFDPIAGLRFLVQEATLNVREDTVPTRAFLGGPDDDAFIVVEPNP
ncbi:gasdermin [Dactylosporangium darangshiense]|uniref:gasdermin n=1 Tax=Dactylosporangium darangshiense TaxID=579108 RepID=UPI003640B6FA